MTQFYCGLATCYSSCAWRAVCDVQTVPQFNGFVIRRQPYLTSINRYVRKLYIVVCSVVAIFTERFVTHRVHVYTLLTLNMYFCCNLKALSRAADAFRGISNAIFNTKSSVVAQYKETLL